MDQVVEGSYMQMPQKESSGQSVYSTLPNKRNVGQEMSLESLKLQTPHNYVLKMINLEPVYVAKETNEMVYNSRMMVKGKKYYIVWDDEKFMLIKEDDGVEIYRFEEDGD